MAVRLIQGTPRARDTYSKDPVIEYWHVYDGKVRAGKVFTRKHGSKVFFSIFLNQNARTRGIGTAATQQFMKETKHKKLFAETRKSNAPMNAVFIKLGWKPVSGQRQALYTWTKGSNKVYTREELIEATTNRLLKLRHLQSPAFAKPHQAYIHFTSLRDAAAIAKTRYIRASTYGPSLGVGIYAVVVGGVCDPRIQRCSARGRSSNKNWAVVFTTKYRPESPVMDNEVAWHMTRLPVDKLKIIPAREANNLLNTNISGYDYPGDYEEINYATAPNRWRDKKLVNPEDTHY